MGSLIEINDTLRITKEQGFPEELNIENHLQDPYHLDNFRDKVFEFKSKPNIRLYKVPPVRNFLVEDIGGKWLYWGLCYIVEVALNYEKGETSGKFKIIRLNTPEEMRQIFRLSHFGHPEQNYFSD